MFDRVVIALKVLCLGLGILFVFQVARFATRKDPVRELRLDTLPDILAKAIAWRSITSSESTNQTHLPLARSRPEFRAAPGPPFSL